MDFELVTVSSAGMTDEQASAVVELCGGVFNIDYAYLMGLCPVRTHVLAYAGRQLVAHASGWIGACAPVQGRGLPLPTWRGLPRIPTIAAGGTVQRSCAACRTKFAAIRWAPFRPR